MVNGMPWLSTPILPDDVRRTLRLQAIFDWNKWDQQIGDSRTFAAFPIVLCASEWLRISGWAEALSAELQSAERELLGRPDLQDRLGLPSSLRRALRAAGVHPTPGAARLVRFDFHYTEEGWRISEANSDVPGGLNEASGYPRLMARHYSGTAPGPDVTDCYTNALAGHVRPGGAVAFVYATAYTDDHQVMDFVARRLGASGIETFLAAPDQLRWPSGRAQVLTSAGPRELDLVVRFFPAEWLSNLPRSCDWTRFFAGGITPVSNPAYAVLTQSKRFPLVWDDLQTPLPTWRSLLPASSEPSRVPWRHDPGWLVKPALGRVGEDIGMRNVVPAKEWKRIERSARWTPKHWIAQRCFVSRTLQNPSGCWYPCIGVYTIDGRIAGAYGRVARKPLVDQDACDAAVLIAEDENP